MAGTYISKLASAAVSKHWRRTNQNSRKALLFLLAPITKSCRIGLRETGGGERWRWRWRWCGVCNSFWFSCAPKTKPKTKTYYRPDAFCGGEQQGRGALNSVCFNNFFLPRTSWACYTKQNFFCFSVEAVALPANDGVALQQWTCPAVSLMNSNTTLRAFPQALLLFLVTMTLCVFCLFSGRFAPLNSTHAVCVV